MKNIFPLSGALLLLSGILHLAKAIINGFTPVIPAFALALFGVAYLIIGVQMLRRRDSALLYAAVVPLIGLVLTLLGGKLNDTFTILFIIIDVLVVAMCGYLLLAGRRMGRVR